MRCRATLLLVLASLCTLTAPSFAASLVKPLKAGVWYDDGEPVTLFGGHAGMQAIARAMVDHQNEAFRDSGLIRTGPTTGYGMDLAHVGTFRRTVGCDLIAIAQEVFRSPKWQEVKGADTPWVILLTQCKKEVHGWAGVTLLAPRTKEGFKNPLAGVVVVMVGALASTDGTITSAVLAHEIGHTPGGGHAVTKTKASDLALGAEDDCPWSTPESAALLEKDIEALAKGEYVFRGRYEERMHLKAFSEDPGVGKSQWPWGKGIIFPPEQPGGIPRSDAMGTLRVLAGNWYANPRRCPPSLPQGTICGVKNQIDMVRLFVTNWGDLANLPAVRLKTRRVP